MRNVQIYNMGKVQKMNKMQNQIKYKASLTVRYYHYHPFHGV